MKIKGFLFTCILISLFYSMENKLTFSADILASVCYSVSDKDALLIGTIVSLDVDGNVMQIEVKRLISGELDMEDGRICLRSRHTAKGFKVGDLVVLSVLKAEDNLPLYEIAYDLSEYKVSFCDGNKVWFLNEKKQDDLDYFDISFQWFCNTGEMLMDEAFTANDGKEYFKYFRGNADNKELVYDSFSKKWYQDCFSSKFIAPNVIEDNQKHMYMLIIKVVIVVVLFSVLLMLLKRRMYRKSSTTKIK